MTTIQIRILSESGENAVFHQLNSLRDQNLISYSKNNAHLTKGDTLSSLEIKQLIDDAVKGPFHSVEEIKRRLKV